MDEKRKFKILEKTDLITEASIEEKNESKKANKDQESCQTSPITGYVYKNLARFCNSKIGEKFSLRDLLR